MEHHLDDDTLNRLAAFVRHVTQCKGNGSALCLVGLRTDLNGGNGK